MDEASAEQSIKPSRKEVSDSVACRAGGYLGTWWRGVIMKEEEGAEDVEPVESQTASPAEKKEDSDIGVERRKDAHGPAQVEATHADGAALLMLVE